MESQWTERKTGDNRHGRSHGSDAWAEELSLHDGKKRRQKKEQFQVKKVEAMEMLPFRRTSKTICHLEGGEFFGKKRQCRNADRDVAWSKDHRPDTQHRGVFLENFGAG